MVVAPSVVSCVLGGTRAMSKFHWPATGIAACGSNAQTFASGMYYSDGASYFADETGQRVPTCFGCLFVAIGEVIATFQAEQRISHRENT